jgi:hypothetical protein
MRQICHCETVLHLLLLQVGKLLAELVREPVAAGAAGGGSSRREGDAGAESTAPGVTAGGWHSMQLHCETIENV